MIQKIGRAEKRKKLERIGVKSRSQVRGKEKEGKNEAIIGEEL